MTGPLGPTPETHNAARSTPAETGQGTRKGMQAAHMEAALPALHRWPRLGTV